MDWAFNYPAIDGHQHLWIQQVEALSSCNNAITPSHWKIIVQHKKFKTIYGCTSIANPFPFCLLPFPVLNIHRAFFGKMFPLWWSWQIAAAPVHAAIPFHGLIWIFIKLHQHDNQPNNTWQLEISQFIYLNFLLQCHHVKKLLHIIMIVVSALLVDFEQIQIMGVFPKCGRKRMHAWFLTIRQQWSWRWQFCPSQWKSENS